MQRTNENWTYGIINIPLLFGHNNRLGVTPRTIMRKFAHNAKCYKKPYYALNKKYRYLWFEQDNKAYSLHRKILLLYASKGIDVFWHETMKGYHYITLHLMERLEYDKLIENIKAYFQNGSFYYSLRIVPNKWVNESRYWYHGYVIDNGSGHRKQLEYIKMEL